ncbi:MAG: S-layer protein [Candidatus Aenigmarchaeota archaeon]|nr:S-layer protein [Candidatus Aenigmarchaeota archaeon]
MQLKKIAAGSLGLLMVGSSLAFAALQDLPAPFVGSSGVQSLIVVGSAAAPSDVVGAIDIAARWGGEVTTEVSVPGAAGVPTVSGEGKALWTDTTKVFLQDNLGKTGLRTTLTKDDLPTILARSSFDDADGTHKYNQFIDLTPVGTAANYRMDYDKPGSSSSADPTYNFGRFTTSPSDTEYLYRTRIVFDVGVNGSKAVGKIMNIFGGKYTIDSTTTANFAGTTSDKVVLLGSSDTKTLSGGQTITTTISGKEYTIKLLGVTSTPAASIQVGDTTETVTKQATSTKFGDLKIYVDDAAQLSTTDQTQNFATLLIGADRITLQHGAKVKKGTSDDPVDGTYVNLTVSSSLLSQITVWAGGSSSTADYIALGGETYMSPIWKNFGIGFPSTSPSVGGSLDDKVDIRNSGDNNMQVAFTDFNGNSGTVNWAYKATSAGTTLSIADSSGNVIHVAENESVARDEYIVLDAGGFPHMFKVSGVTLDGSTSASIDLQDVFSGSTTKVTTGNDNREGFVIDGQTYNFVNLTSTTFAVTWGTSAGLGTSTTSSGIVGTYLTVFPTLKTKNGARVALTKPSQRVYYANQNTTIQLPTGAILLTNANATVLNITAASQEDGTASACASSPCVLNFDETAATNTTFTLGRTTAGGVTYNIVRDVANSAFNISIADGAQLNQPAIIVWEEKDDNGNQAGVIVQSQTGASGSNNLAGAGTPNFTASVSAGAQSWGSNSNKASNADYWGTVSTRDTSTSAQPTVTLWYPDTQRYANVFVLAKGATVSSSGVSGTVKSAVPIKTPLGKLDSEVTSADKSTKNLVLVGGPVVNTLVAELAAAGKSRDTAWYRTQGAGTALIDYVSDAFTAGKVALVVAGHSAADTRTAASWVQNFDAHASDLKGMRVVLKNGVLQTSAA